jgi:hypothetical protein
MKTETAASDAGTLTSQQRRPSQNDQILDLLADGHWHTTAAILHAVPCIVHSRIAEIKSRGHLIEHRGGGSGAQNHEYRLVPAMSDEAAQDQGLTADPPRVPAASSGTAAKDALAEPTSEQTAPAFQLSVFDVAA